MGGILRQALINFREGHNGISVAGKIHHKGQFWRDELKASKFSQTSSNLVSNHTTTGLDVEAKAAVAQQVELKKQKLHELI